jgi:hypothetical protein
MLKIGRWDYKIPTLNAVRSVSEKRDEAQFEVAHRLLVLVA